MCLNFSAIFSDFRVIVFTKPSQIGQLSPFFAKNPKKSEQNGKFPASALQNGKKSAIIIMYEVFCKKTDAVRNFDGSGDCIGCG